MGGCSAINCKNRSEKGFHMYRFPSDPTRRNRWIVNTRRKNFDPRMNTYLCEVHFEKSEFEQGRIDGKRKLKWNAVPTLFNVPNPPKKVNPSPRKSLYKRNPEQKNMKSVNHTIDLAKWEENNFETEAISNEKNTSIAECNPITDERVRLFTSSRNEWNEPVPRIQITSDEKNISPDEENHKESSQPKTYTQEEVDRRINFLMTKYESDTKLQNKTDLLISVIQEKNEKLKKTVQHYEKMLKSFLNDDQIEVLKTLADDPKLRVPVKEWSNEAIIKALKLRFALGIHGYEDLRNTGYPLPSYRTLCRRLVALELNFGIFRNLLIPLQSKLSGLDKYCVLSIDEMQIDDRISIDKHKMIFQNGVTLGSATENTFHVLESVPNVIHKKGTQLLVALLRGVKQPWKQVIGSHITGNGSSGVDLKKFIFECISFAEELELQVIALSSDMGGKSRSLWRELGIYVKKNGIRKNNFEYNGKPVYIIADQCHLLKNLKSSLLNGTFRIPEYAREKQNLPTNIAAGHYIRTLWKKETEENREIRLLHHLKEEDIYPSNFQKMNVGAAIRFFSLQTAAAIETAVKLKEIPVEALSTSYLIRLIYQWFEIVNSKMRKTSITKKNQMQKLEFLTEFIQLINDIQINESGWKPLNTGLILTSISLFDITHFVFQNGHDFILTHRFTQDALENVFSQVRRRAGKLPSSSDCISVMKTICVSQFVSDIKRTNYCTDSAVCVTT